MTPTNRTFFQDWDKMKLRRMLSEDKDYVIVSLPVWYDFLLLVSGTESKHDRQKLHEWYNGGPEIRLFLTGDYKSSSKYSNGAPDKAPITLHYRAIGQKLASAFLFSLNGTCKQLVQYVAELAGFNPSQTTISFVRKTDFGGSSTVYINPTKDKMW